MTPSRTFRPQRGFTLIELLVTILVVTVGLLGVAKLQAAAMAETNVARTRSLMTFQAEALAAAMRSNRAFWQTATAPLPCPSVSTTAGVTTVVDSCGALGSLPGGSNCQGSTVCTAPNLAYDDVNTWAQSFGVQFPNATASIVCAVANSSPETCDITLNWTENSVAINRTTAAAAMAAGGSIQNASNLVLHIQP